MSIEGEWRGSYSYDEKSIMVPGGPQPIFARFRLDGTRLSGLMQDERTKNEMLYHDVYEASQDQYSDSARQSALRFLRENPKALFQTLLPEKSDLLGEFHDPHLSFVKSYRGHYIHQFVVGWRKSIVQDTQGHQVFYEGALVSPNQIQGVWRIPGNPNQGTSETTGTFQLTRAR